MKGDLCRMLRDVVGELQSKRNQADGEFYKRQREADALQYYLKAEAEGWANQVLDGFFFFPWILHCILLLQCSPCIRCFVKSVLNLLICNFILVFDCYLLPFFFSSSHVILSCGSLTVWRVIRRNSCLTLSASRRCSPLPTARTTLRMHRIVVLFCSPCRYFFPTGANFIPESKISGDLLRSGVRSLVRI